ncbi:MAG: MmgE/PrpD family protein [Tistlia sp.]|uniref:MmgE/PrpD family protein n=1 Tax=Tistlia sp. TaxID=3057121 RepID=UPI0034A4A51C
MDRLETVSTTRRLATFVAQTTWETLPEAARESSKQAIADCIGGALAGAAEPPAVAAMRMAQGEPGEAVIWGSVLRTGERTAALVNGTMAHAHDIDDTNESMRGHPSAPVVPAAFAVGGAGPGQDLILAYAVGVEVEAKLGRAMNMEHYERGWHTTSTLGSLGAAAAAASLLGLDAERCAHALAIAASTACGLRANFGTMTKPLHAGLAAENGVLAARLAAAGLTANPTAIEAAEGFFDLFCGSDNVAADRAVAGLGAPFDVVSPGIIYKLYPTCSLTHHVLDLLFEGIASGAIEPATIEHVDCGIGYRCEKTLPYHRPTNGLEGKFSMEYCIAAALHYGQVGFAEFSDEAVNAPEIAALYPKLNIYLHSDLRERDSVFNDFADIEIRHRDGRVFHERLYKPKGHPSNPLTWDDLEAKFRRCADPAVGAAAAARIWGGLRSLETLAPGEVNALF